MFLFKQAKCCNKNLIIVVLNVSYKNVGLFSCHIHLIVVTLHGNSIHKENKGSYGA